MITVDEERFPAGEANPALAMADAGEMEAGPDPQQRAKDIRDCLMRVMRNGHTNAQEINRPFHDRFQLYRRLRRAIAPLDGDPGDALAELYSPAIGSLVETAKSQELTTLVPDPAAMDHVEVHPEEMGVDEYCEAATSKLRNEYRAMKPQDAENGLVDILDKQIEDRYVVGNCLEMRGHQVLSGEMEGDPYIAGCVKEYVDPVCTYPWNMAVTSARRQKFTFYDPCTDDDLERFGIPDDIIEQVREECRVEPLPAVDPESQDSEFYLGVNTNLNNNADAYKRITFKGAFPFYEFRRAWGQQRDDLPDKAEIVSALAGLFGFDLAEVQLETYWDIQWIYPVMIRCRPYQLDLAPGQGPILHECQYKVAGQFWGEGFYDRNQLHERLANYFQQCAARIAGFLADPPTIFRKYMLDMDHLQLNGVTPRLEHGMAIFAKASAGNPNEKPVEPLLLNANSLQPLIDQEAGQKEQIRQATGVYSDVQGQSQSKLATVNANNMQQGLMLFQASMKRFENGFMKNGAEADYVVMCQAIRMGGVDVNVPVSVENKILKSLTLSPDMLKPMGCVSIRMTGASNPGNRQHMIESLLMYWDKVVPTGVADVPFLAKMIAQFMDLPQKEKIIHDPSNADLFKRFVNAKQLLGDGAIQYFTPMELMALGFTPPPAPPTGPDGKPVPGANPGHPGMQPSQPAGLPPAPGPPDMGSAGGGAPEMMPGNNGYSRMMQ